MGLRSRSNLLVVAALRQSVAELIPALSPLQTYHQRRYVWHLPNLPLPSFKRKYEDTKERMKINREMKLGVELAAADMIVNMNGRVRFRENDKWFQKSSFHFLAGLPFDKLHHDQLVAIDASNTEFSMEFYPYLSNLKYLKFLSVSGCELVDDFFLPRLVIVRESLEYLDVSRCPNITHNSFTALCNLRNLRMLDMSDMPHVQHKELLAIMLQEVLPNCQIRGVNLDWPHQIPDDT